jgi:hypothetical protein
LKRTSLGPLRQGQQLDTSETKHAQAKSANHRNRARTPQRPPPAHMQAPPEPKHTPPEQMQQCNAGMQQRGKTCSLCPGQLDRLYRAVRPPVPHLTAWGAVRPALHETAQNLPEQIGTPSKHSQVPKECTNFSPLLTMHESRQNAKTFNIYLLKYTKFITKSYTSPNEQVRYSTGS